MNRRDFIRGLGQAVTMASTAGAAASGVFTAATGSAADAWKITSNQLHSRMDKLSNQIQTFEAQMSGRMNELTLDIEYQRWMMRIIFLLLIISFAIDGGMALAFVR
jgi:hypothetical protein